MLQSCASCVCLVRRKAQNHLSHSFCLGAQSECFRPLISCLLSVANGSLEDCQAVKSMWVCGDSGGDGFGGLWQNSSGSTTTRSDYSLPDYEAFYSDDDHIKEKSSGNTTTHADFSQYDSSIFDLLINPFPPADMSDFYHKDSVNELAHIISPLEYDCFCFKIEPKLGNLTIDVDFPDSEVSKFCPLINRASNPQLQLGIRYPNLID
ncbi:hypothetical protein Tco_1503088 [Tanacetum coccineum]